MRARAEDAAAPCDPAESDACDAGADAAEPITGAVAVRAAGDCGAEAADDCPSAAGGSAATGSTAAAATR